MDFLVYDLEIVNMIPDRNGFMFPKYSYCRGWQDHKGMGISVIGYWSSKDESLYYTLDPEVFGVVAAQHDLIVGFNSASFDDNVLAVNRVNVQTGYDLLEQVRIAAGFDKSYQSVPSGYSYKLDAIAKANGMAKMGSGELAPQLWQDGKKQEVIEYCLHDVEITVDLLHLGLEGSLVDPNTGKLLKLAPLPHVETQLTLLK